MAIADKILDIIRQKVNAPPENVINRIKSLSKRIDNMPPSMDLPADVQDQANKLKDEVEQIEKGIEDAQKIQESAEKVQNSIDVGIKTADTVIKAQEVDASPMNPVAVGIKQAQEFIRDNLKKQLDNLDTVVEMLKGDIRIAQRNLFDALEELNESIKKNREESRLYKDRKDNNE